MLARSWTALTKILGNVSTHHQPLSCVVLVATCGDFLIVVYPIQPEDVIIAIREHYESKRPVRTGVIFLQPGQDFVYLSCGDTNVRVRVPIIY